MSCSEKKIACVNCRSSKTKCVGGDAPSFSDSNLSAAQLACERCRKSGLECIWQASKKTGRPSKTTAKAVTLDMFEAYSRGVPLIGSEDVEQVHDLVYYAALTISDNFKGLDVISDRASMLSLAEEAILTHKCDLRSIIGLIYTIHDDYGANNTEAAQYHLSYVCRVALELGLNTRSPRIDPFDDPLSSIYGRIWWEIYLLDVLLHLSTSGQIARQINSLTIIDIDANSIATDVTLQQAYDGRIKSALILSESTKIDGRLNFERVSALDTMITNQLALTQSSYHSDENFTIKELNFTSTMMLLASRVHLHRQAWFADMTFDFQSCSFRQKMSEMEMLLNDMFVMPSSGNLDASLCASLHAIRESSQQMLHWIRVDEVYQSQSASTTPPHWPFYSCCQLVASYGPILEIAILNASRNSENGVLETVAAPENGVWKTRAALSSVDLTHATLARYMKVWMIAGVYRDEVAVCRAVVDTCGPTGFGM
ncbi:hypothetical protein J056_001872 [Wallemia ichthyophaga EXF-994]|uniref:Zn(2)-C6 fungal-type domain-containing protein n=1 Tax=Wallemia ichthyophaga (strain EXF-994 / CBS 113033) TaxID=1299270 RepID=R9AAW2_WALI9|nr:uncharacterized protein J056_001872 [Wallemia ichthyophaga EXF-994]EOQ99316.1 hypothetical protein J056_001872 [Wallemia ichthyophaga EXF-994]